MRRQLAAVLGVTLAACGGHDGGDPVLVSDGLANVRLHAIAFDGTDYALAWVEAGAGPTTDRLWFTRIGASGAVATPATPVFDLGETIAELWLSAAGGRYVAWYRVAGTGTTDLIAAAIDPDGDLPGPPSTLDALTEDPNPTYGPRQSLAVTWAGDRFAVASQVGDPLALYLTTYSIDLASIDRTQLEVSTNPQSEPAATWSAEEQRVIVAWRELERIRAARAGLDTVLTAASSPVGDLGDDQFGPAATTGAGGTILGWTEGNYDDGRRLGFATEPPGGEWRLLSGLVPDNRYEWLAPAVALRAGVATVAWASDAETALAQISVGTLAIATDVQLRGVQSLTSGRAPYDSPRLAAGTDEVGLAYRGIVDGAVRLYFTTVP